MDNTVVEGFRPRKTRKARELKKDKFTLFVPLFYLLLLVVSFDYSKTKVTFKRTL